MASPKNIKANGKAMESEWEAMFNPGEDYVSNNTYKSNANEENNNMHVEMREIPCADVPKFAAVYHVDGTLLTYGAEVRGYCIKNRIGIISDGAMIRRDGSMKSYEQIISALVAEAKRLGANAIVELVYNEDRPECVDYWTNWAEGCAVIISPLLDSSEVP